MFKKLILSLVAILMVTSFSNSAYAYRGRGGDGDGLAWGILGGVIIGSALAHPYYYSGSYYDPYAYGNVYTYAPPPVYYAQPTFVPASPYVYQAPVYAQPQPYCREYTQNIIVNGYMQQSYGTACLQPDGSWRIVN